MDAAQDPPDWTREVAALRRVARGLLADEHAADDVLQDAWLRAHRRGPAAAERPAAYWKRAVANLVRDRRRGEARRAERERHVARPEALPSTDEVAARLELVQRVARAAAALPEPYRSTIHNHYFEDLSAQEIAERAGLSPETVRTRIRRGLERMRAELDAASGGDRRAWCLALAPLAVRSPSAAAPTGGALAAAAGGIVAMNKLALAAAGALVAVAALWFATRGVQVSPPVATAQAAATSSGPEADAARAAEPGAPDGAHDERLALAATVAAEGPGDGLVELIGSFALLDGNGVLRTDVDGLFFLQRTAADGRIEEQAVQFEHGRWSARAALGESLNVHDVYAAGHPARVSSQPLPVPADGRVALEAVSWPRTRLRVVDRATGLDLDEVELRWSGFGSMAIAERHPGDPSDRQVQILGLSSPFEVGWPGPGAEDQAVRLWVSAPELAWAHVDVVPSAGGSRTVELSSCGDLEVFPTGPRPARGWLVCLVEIRGDPPTSEQYAAWQVAAEGDVTRFERLAPGRYRVQAMWNVGTPGLGGSSEEFEVHAGEVTRVSLPLELAEAGPRVHVLGTLTWIEGTPMGDLVLLPVSRELPQEQVVLGRAKMRPDPDRPRMLHWDAGDLVRGEYLAIDAAAGLRHRFETGLGPERRLELALPQQVELVVRVLDDRDRAPLSEAKVSWTLQRIDDGGYEVWTETSDPARLGFVRFEAPAVPLVLDVVAPGFSSQSQHVMPRHDATTELEFRLHRESGLRVRFLEGDALIPGFLARPQVRDASGERVAPLGWGREPSACRILLDPGDYRLDFADLGEAWQTPASIDVRVVEGVLTPVDVPLVRAP